MGHTQKYSDLEMNMKDQNKMSKLSQKGMFDDVFNKREQQLQRVIKSIKHLPYEHQINTLLSWMGVEDVDYMLETLDPIQETNGDTPQ